MMSTESTLQIWMFQLLSAIIFVQVEGDHVASRISQILWYKLILKQKTFQQP